VPPLIQRYPQLDFERYVTALEWSGDRAGFVACGDIGVSLGVLLQEDEKLKDVRITESNATESPLARSQRIRALVSFALSDEYFALRQRLG